MVTNWRELIPRIAKDTGNTEEYVKEQILLYTKTLKEGMKNYENVEYDFFYLGKIYTTRRKFDKYQKEIKEYDSTTDKHLENLDKIDKKLKEINSVGRQPGKPRGKYKRKFK